MGELASTTERIAEVPEGFLTDKIEEWRHQKTLALAAEVIGASVVLGREPEAEEAARFIIASGERCPLPVRELAGLITDSENAQTADVSERPNIQVRLLRRRLRDTPRNAVAWADLSREYASLGLTDKASRAMKVAVALAPDHRFIVRSAARLFVHLGDPKYAHDLLLRTGSTANDPWLMAAEIAVASVAGETPEYTKLGRKLIRGDKFSSQHISELASAIGTLEFEHGNQRAGRRLFREALIRPTANTVGQARWVQNAAGMQLLDSSALSTPRAFEARAWQKFYNQEWQDSFDETQRWLNDEPYSSRPAVLGSYVAASILEHYDDAVGMARIGLRANPEDATLINNLAFALINCGELDEAERNLHKLQSSNADREQDIMLKATTGLLKFRRGDPDKGRELYVAAIQMASDLKYRILHARAAIFLALEEKRVKSPYVKEAMARAFSSTESLSHPDISFLLSRFK